MVGFVEDHEVPIFRLDQLARAITPSHQVAGAEDQRLLMPFRAANLAFPRPNPAVGLAPEKLLPVVDRHVQVELLIKLVLPLAQDGGGDHQQEI